MSLARDLLLFAEELKKNYSGENKQRFSFIALYNHLASNIPKDDKQQDNSRILLGALIFEQEYSRSGAMHKLIKKKLTQLAPDNLNDDERLICLLHFYKQVQQIPPFYFKSLFKINKQHLLKETCLIMKSVKERETERLALFVEGEPRIKVLEQAILNLADDYHKTKHNESEPQPKNKGWFANLGWFGSSNPKREALISFIKWVNETCKDLQPVTQDERDKDLLYMETCSIRLGAFLFAILDIEHEYKLFSPHGSKLFRNRGSELFKQCLHAINATQTNLIKRDKKVEWLNALSEHLVKVKQDTAYYEEKRKILDPQHLKYIDEFQGRLDDYLVQQKMKKKRPSRTARYLTTATSYAAQYGVSFAITQAVATAAIPSLTGAAVMTGPVGLVVYGSGAILMTQIGRLVGDKVLPNVAGYLCAWALERIGDSIADTTVGAATYTFSATKEGLNSLLGHPKLKNKDRKFLKEWINTLLDMPEEEDVIIVSKEEKQQIRAILSEYFKENPEEGFELIPKFA